MDIDTQTITQLVADLKQVAEKCPRCEGARETVFTSRGRDNIVPCLQCEPIYRILEHLEAALKLLKEI